MPGNETTDYTQWRNEQVQNLESLNVEVMQGPHFAAFFRGFPPDDFAIVTPRAFLEDLQAGRAPESETPINQAQATLHNLLGDPTHSIRLTSAFNSAPPESPLSVANFLKPSAPGT